MTQLKNTILQVPAENDYLVAVRAIVAATAAHSGLPVGYCDKARTAAHEAAGLIMLGNPQGPITCEIGEGEDTITVTISAVTADEIQADPTNIAWVLLDSATQTHSISYEGSTAGITFTIAAD